MLTILLKLPRTEKFSIGTEVKTSMYRGTSLEHGLFFKTRIISISWHINLNE